MANFDGFSAAPAAAGAAQAHRATRVGSLLLAGAVLSGLALSAIAALAASPGRMILWQAVRACVADSKLLGAPFPCLMVDLSGGEDRGYVVLRAPFGPPDTILAPTRKVVGVEDPWLQSPDAPNYFAAAWRARSLFEENGRKPPPPAEFAVAVNSALTRSQDQLHIHMGCLGPYIRRALTATAQRLPIGAWERIGNIVPGTRLFAFRTGKKDLDGIYPFRLAAEGLAERTRNRAQLTIFVTQVQITSDEFIVLASPGGFGPYDRLTAEDILDPACSSPPGLSRSN